MALSKMKKTQLYFIVYFIILANVTQAQVADLALSIEIENIENGVEFGQTGSFIVTITNFGPDDAGITSTSALPVRASSNSIGHTDDAFIDVSFLQDFSFMEDCFFIRIDGSPIPGGSPHSAYSVKFPIIPVNTSMTCHGYYHVGFREDIRTITWRAISGFNQDENDPNPDNNEVSLVFRTKPQIIPILNWQFLGLLIFFIFSTVFIRPDILFKKDKK